MPESNAEALVILSNYHPGYWWDHTHLTVYVQAHPSATDEQIDAIEGAIHTWDTVLRDCFDDLITLTQVDSRQAADIVVHYVPTAGAVTRTRPPRVPTTARPDRGIPCSACRSARAGRPAVTRTAAGALLPLTSVATASESRPLPR
jgi:hypothetical protein